jgi:hypothetical protein
MLVSESVRLKVRKDDQALYEVVEIGSNITSLLANIGKASTCFTQRAARQGKRE